MKFLKNKKSFEIGTKELIGLVLGIIAIILIIYFFTKNYNAGANNLIDTGKGSFEMAKNMT